MRAFPAIVLGLSTSIASCTAALEGQVSDLTRQMRELRRGGSATQVRQEEMANRLLLVEDEVARRRVAEAASPKVAPPPATEQKPAPAPSVSVTSSAITTGKTLVTSPATKSSVVISSPTDEPDLPLVRYRPRPGEDDTRSRDVLGSGDAPTGASSPAPTGRAVATSGSSSVSASLSVPGASATNAAQPEPPLLPVKALYASGLAAFRAGELARSRHLFAAVLRRFPDHSLADNALYWTGRAHTQALDHAAAVASFELLLERYPTGNKVPDALLALSSALANAGRAGDARTRLALLAKNFPATTAAKQARARLREMKE